jgi:hypothetical protein
MKAHARKAFKKLEKLGCPVKEWHDDSRGHFWISAEEGDHYLWLDYYDDEMYWGSKKLQKILEDNDLYFEWYNPGYACVYDR